MSDDFRARIEEMSVSELRARIINQRSLIEAYQQCLDGLDLKIPGCLEGHRTPEDIRRQVELLLSSIAGLVEDSPSAAIALRLKRHEQPEMKTLSSLLTRRDRCYVFGRRAAKLTPPQAVEAWYALSEKVEAMGEMDVPKFNDLLIAMRVATVRGKRERQPANEATT